MKGAKHKLTEGVLTVGGGNPMQYTDQVSQMILHDPINQCHRNTFNF